MKAIKGQWIIRQAFGLVCGSLLACGLVAAQEPAPTEQAPEQLLSAEQLNSQPNCIAGISLGWLLENGYGCLHFWL
jgi:hypothetical protein